MKYDEVSFLGLCPFCEYNDDYYVYQWDYCDQASGLIIDENANGICVYCKNFKLGEG